MLIDSTQIVDTFAEAFRLRFARLVVTAHDGHWLEAAVRSTCGYGTSVIGCDAEAGLEGLLPPEATPDGRVGAAIMLFGFTTEAVGRAAGNRVAQCLLTCPTTAVFDGLPEAVERVPLGSHVRYFGDGFEESAGVEKGVGGGNFLVQGESLEATLAATRRGVAAIADLPGVITPFPGGAVRSGSKVGSRYQALKASTNEAFSPALAGRVPSELHPDAACCIEVVIDGESEAAVAGAMAAGIRAAAGPGIPAIAAGNYGGKLGKFQFPLRDVLAAG